MPKVLRRARVALGADAEPAEIDEPNRERARPFGIERLARHVLAHRLPQIRKPLRKADEPVELLLLLLGAKLRVVEVLAPSGSIDAGCLELRFRPGRDPDVAPRGRDHELLDSRDLLRIGDRASRASRDSETAPCRPWRRQPPLRAMRAVYPRAVGSNQWPRRRSPSSKGTRPGRSSSTKRCACSIAEVDRLRPRLRPVRPLARNAPGDEEPGRA